jgi:branched-chain amino acid transport system permease protein
MFVQQLFNGLVIGAAYGLFAIGFTLLFGVNQILNLAHGAVLMASTFAALYSILYLKLPFVLALLVAAVFGGLLSVLLNSLVFQPQRKRQAPEFSAIVASIGAALIIEGVAQRVSETRVLSFPPDSFPTIAMNILGIRVQLIQVMILACFLLFVLGLTVLLYRTSFGRQIRAVAANERAARLVGINQYFVFRGIFFIAGALAGVAGVLIGLAYNSIHFLMGEPLLLRALVIVVLGGLGSLWGALIAGLVLGVAQSLSIGYFSSTIADLAIFVFLFILLLVRPTGLFGNPVAVRRIVRQ